MPDETIGHTIARALQDAELAPWSMLLEDRSVVSGEDLLDRVAETVDRVLEEHTACLYTHADFVQQLAAQEKMDA